MKDINKLLADHRKLIEYEASKRAQFLSPYVVQAEAFKLAHEAAEKYDDKLGVKFSTYLTHYLQKLDRLSTTYGNVTRKPEHVQFKLNKLNKITSDLEDKIGRNASLAELSDASGFNIPQVKSLLASKRSEVSISNVLNTPVFIENSNDEWVRFVYHDLTDRDKLVFEHKTGFAGKPTLSNAELATKLGVSASVISTVVNRISKKLEEGWKEHGSN